MKEFQVIKDGDRVLIALSGGKDSLSLIHILTAAAAHNPAKV